jgi:ankyrin repeat protein
MDNLHVLVVTSLVQEYFESLQVTGYDCHLPLHSACYRGALLDVVRYLVPEYP